MAVIPPHPISARWSTGAPTRERRRRRRLDPRRIVKQALASALSSTGADALFGAMRRGSAPLVLAYHRVVDNYEESSRRGMPGMLVSRRMLERHLDRISRRYRFVTLDEIGAALHRRERGARAVAAVTFDDGYRDVYDHALPLLVRKGIPAAVFVVSDLVGQARLQLHDQLYFLLLRGVVCRPALHDVLQAQLRAAAVPEGRRDGIQRASADAMALTRALLQALTRAHLQSLMRDLEQRVGAIDAGERPDLFSLSWEMLIEMRARGFTIGSHTRGHALLGQETVDVQAREVEGSRRVLEARLGPIAHFAYPDGSFNRAAVKAVADAGYQWAYTSCPHCDRRHPGLTIPRRVLWEYSSVNASGEFDPAILDCQTQGFFSGRRDCRRASHA